MFFTKDLFNNGFIYQIIFDNPYKGKEWFDLQILNGEMEYLQE